MLVELFEILTCAQSTCTRICTAASAAAYLHLCPKQLLYLHKNGCSNTIS